MSISAAREEIERESKRARDKRMRDERERVERELDEGRREAEEFRSMTTKKTGKPRGKGAAVKLQDDELGKIVAGIMRKDPATTRGGLVKAVRSAGHSASQKRIQKFWSAPGKASGKKASKKAKASKPAAETTGSATE